MLVAFLAWMHANASFITMAAIGAAIAHVKAYEASKERQPASWHAYTFGKNLIYAAFVSMAVYHAHIAWGWNEQLSFILCGLCSVFAEDTITLLWRGVRARFLKEANLEETPKDKQP